MIELLSDQGPAPAFSNTELLMLMYHRCRREAEEVIFLLSTYTELVDSEAVGKQKELMLGTLMGVLRAMADQLGSRETGLFNLSVEIINLFIYIKQTNWYEMFILASMSNPPCVGKQVERELAASIESAGPDRTGGSPSTVPDC